MNFKIGDLVTRNSYNNDIVFKIKNISDSIAYLKGTNIRLYADSKLDDLKIYDKQDIDDFADSIEEEHLDRDSFFYLPAKLLHLDSDESYINKCLNYYKRNKLQAVGKLVSEEELPNKIIKFLKEYNPDIVIITGHDSYFSKKNDKNNLDNYRNSKYFCEAVSKARNYEKNHDKLVIIAGACQSNYEALIKSGADFASSPKRVNIHALDPAIIATTIALTDKSKPIDLISLLNKTKYGSNGMGGLMGNGLMYVGYPRWLMQ